MARRHKYGFEPNQGLPNPCLKLKSGLSRLGSGPYGPSQVEPVGFSTTEPEFLESSCPLYLGAFVLDFEQSYDVG